LPGIAAARRVYRVTILRPEGPVSAREFRRRTYPTRRPPETANGWLVVIEDGRPRDVQATRSSVRRANEGAQVVVVPPGAELAPVVGDASFVVVLRPGDILLPGALRELAHAHLRDPRYQVLVFDTESLEGARLRPHLRPSWSPDMLLGADYVDRAVAFSAHLLVDAGTVLSDRDLWRTLLAADLDAESAGRVARVLVRSRDRVADRRVADAADAAMVREVLGARGVAVSSAVESGVVRVRHERADWPSVSVVIPSRHDRANLGRLLPGLLASDYPDLAVTVVDNGGRTAANEKWYRQFGERLTVLWWTEPFNYSAVNNAGAAATTGELLVFLNDDTEVLDAGWLRELAGWALQDGVGTVGATLLRDDDRIQHGGVVLGPSGFADNMFTGLRPGEDTLLGPTSWYRNTSAVTGACTVVRRELFNEVGGFDERFQLMGSDVVLGLDMLVRGRRNVVVPFRLLRHFEAVTRGSAIPPGDFHASYFRYHSWLLNGDPYWSPALSSNSGVPQFPRRGEVSAIRRSIEGLGLPWRSLAQSSSISEEASGLVDLASVSRETVGDVRAQHAALTGPREVRTLNWFLPEIDLPYFGGINTALRIADHLRREQGVRNRFVILGPEREAHTRAAIAAAFEGLADSELHFYNGQPEQIAAIPPADAAIATLWLTAVHVAQAPTAGRRFYLVQDYEPGFYPASTMFALAEETYRLGLYGICNTAAMHRMYRDEYGGTGIAFAPAVDRDVFHPEPRRSTDGVVTIFAYARDHFRNCWELVYPALSEIKSRHGDKVRIVAAGARYLPPSADFIDLGLRDVRETGRVYRSVDIGVTMQISRHPSYLPLELMASGAAVVVADSRWFDWLFRDGENALQSMRSLDDLVDRIDSLVVDAQLRARIAAGGLATIDAAHSDWDAAIAPIADFLRDPEAIAGGPPAVR
jgi:GT2 family glycosyltransferase/glycosyltransferase involved in cell wall biosynthesis